MLFVFSSLLPCYQKKFLLIQYYYSILIKKSFLFLILYKIFLILTMLIWNIFKNIFLNIVGFIIKMKNSKIVKISLKNIYFIFLTVNKIQFLLTKIGL